MSLPPSLEMKMKELDTSGCQYSQELLNRFEAVEWKGMIGPSCDCVMEKDQPPCQNKDCPHHPNKAIDKGYGMNLELSRTTSE
jgi:hypothetical protein